MVVLVNGQFVPESEAMISIADRGFLYGDGLFETIPVHQGDPVAWSQHLNRLVAGAEYLRLPLPFNPSQMRSWVDTLVHYNRLPHSVLRLTLTRGGGPRGYSISGCTQPTLVMVLHPAPARSSVPGVPDQWRLVTASIRVQANDPLARFKTCNKLPHILARAEAEERNAHDAILLNHLGELAETSSANLFWILNNQLSTPSQSTGALPGVTRQLVCECAASLGLSCLETTASPQTLAHADGVFLTLSTQGIVEAVALDESPLSQSPLTQTLHTAYLKLTNQVTPSTSYS